MKKWLLSILLAILMTAGTDAADLDKYLGHWTAKKGDFLIISENNGEPLLTAPANEYWRAEFQNVRLEDGRLKFEQINYLKDEFKEGGEDHPYSGVVNYVEMWEDDAGQWHYRAWTDEVPEFTGELWKKTAE